MAKGGPKKPANVPDHDPPQGYICYRCGEKGHWIQLCPTNDNPDYDNRPRVKRTTGIPRSFLKTVDKATALGQNADGDESKAPSGIMVNADGEFVIAEPDKASWEQFQAKAKANPAAKVGASEGDKEVRERGLECPVDKKMFIEPMKTPCCEKTYCNDCITNALIESDFVCPGCKTEGVLIDDLKTDEEAVEKIKTFLAEKDNKTKEGSKSPKSPSATTSVTAAGEDGADAKSEPTKAKSKSPTPATATPATTQPSTSAPMQKSTSATGDQSATSKKRPAEDVLENPKIPKAPKAMQQAQGNPMMDQMMGMNGMGMNPMMNPMMYPGMPGMMGNFNPMAGMPNMNPMAGMMNPMAGMMNPMMAGGFQGMGNNGMWGGGPGGNNMAGMNYGGGGPRQQQQFYHHNQHRQQQQYQQHQQHQQHMMMHGGGKNFGNQAGPGGGGGVAGAEEEDAYFRKPVNPHRHQNRQRRVRPSDYREL